MRQQVIGIVGAERVAAPDSLENSDTIEGRDDTASRRSAPRGPGTTIHRRNVHAPRDVGSDPSTRFHAVRQGFDSLHRLTDTITNLLDGPPPAIPQPPRRMADLVDEYARFSALLSNATSDVDVRFYQRALDNLIREQDELFPSSSRPEPPHLAPLPPEHAEE